MSNIKPILSLNKHPKDYENLSLVNARNIQISNDLSVIENEKNIIVHPFFDEISHYLNNLNIKFVGSIPCNTEIIFFVIEVSSDLIINDNGIQCYIFRCNESTNEVKLVTDKYKYFGGTIVGTFTYNSRNELILGISEYNAIIDIPLKSFNIGTWENNTSDDINLSYDNLSIVPTVKIPEFRGVNFEEGNTYKGWYNFFIRFKINKNDYTQWYPIGYSIFLGSLESINMFKVYGYSGTNEKFVTGFTDNIDGKMSYSNETISFILNSIKEYNPEYNFYQLAYVCSTTSSTLIKRTEDISININKYKITQENFNIESTLEELTTDYYNYYDVKNIINYQNRLYIADYKEKEDIKNINEIVSNIKLSCICNYTERKDLLFTLWNNSSQYISENRKEIILSDIINSGNNTIVTIKATGRNTGFYSQLMSSTNGTSRVKIPYILGDTGVLVGFDMHHSEGYYESDNAYISINGQHLYQFHETINIEYITNQGMKILTNLDYNATANINGKDYKLRIQASRGDRVYTVTESNLDDLFSTIADVEVNSNNIIIKNENGNTVFINKETGIEYTSGNFEISINDNVIGNIDLTGFKNCPLIDTNKSFQDRKLNDTLIPGEIYSFYIHFIDKYGEVTRGYKLSNNYTYKYNGKEVVPIGLILNNNGISGNVIALIPIGHKIFNDSGIVVVPDDISFWRVVTSVNKGNDSFSFGGRFYNDINESYFDALREKVKELNPNMNAYWEDLPDGFGQLYWTDTDNYSFNKYLDYIGSLGFIQYINSNGDKLFKVPDLPIICDKNGVKVPNTLEEDFYSYRFPNIKLFIEDVQIPEGYIGYFISYEQFEQSIKNTGILTNADFINYNISENVENGFINHNKSTSNNIYFYSSKFDINEKLDLNYSFIDIKSRILFDDRSKHIVVREINSNFKYYNLNNPILAIIPNSKCNRISNYTVVAGGDISKNRNGLGTALQLDNQYNLFDETEIKFYYARLIFINHNIYTSSNKKLIRLTNYIYSTSNRVILNGYNGYHTYDGICCYNANKIIMNTSSTKIVNEIFKNYDANYPIAAYFQFPLIDTYFNETKSFNNEPQFISTLLASVDDLDKKDQIGQFSVSSYISPENSIDLYVNKYINKDNFIVKFYENYNKDLEYIYHFTKYIRRSNIIQDESLINAWRQFPLEGYKIITENKGIITNLVGIGTILIVHCEHSMFMFDRDNTLNTIDKSVQLQMPDIFDIDYKEVFTSDLGFGGLQDKFAYIVDQFGYIFYDNSNNRFYRFDNGQLNYIDTDIIEFTKQYKPYNVRFANDKIRNRLLINIQFDINNEVKRDTLSYNYNSNNFVSWHDIIFDIAYSTKSNLYLINRNKNYISLGTDCILYYDFNNNFARIILDPKDFSGTKDIKLEFIVNDNYNLIKYLEYITYKLYILNAANINNYDKHIGERKQPFSGQTLRVYNDLIDTGELDILIDDEKNKNIFGNYKKPYWDLGNWNFSYLRNAKYGQQLAMLMSRLYGNYFIISFTLNNQIETNKIEFEDINYVISKDKI